ncbi:MAG: SprT family zinc-dependent metalloprotease [Patescibacteria group bacterium]
MERVIRVGEREIIYTLRRSHRARHVRITIHYNGNVIVTAPRRIHQSFIEQFILHKSSWILKKLAYIRSLGPAPIRRISRQDYMRYKMSARLLAENRIEHFNTAYGLSYGRISIRNQTTRWGSCSGGGNLNFNYRIALLPSYLCDYIIVHELCHVAELNHSQRFWNLVAKTIPYYAEARRELRRHGL